MNSVFVGLALLDVEVMEVSCFKLSEPSLLSDWIRLKERFLHKRLRVLVLSPEGPRSVEMGSSEESVCSAVVSVDGILKETFDAEKDSNPMDGFECG